MPKQKRTPKVIGSRRKTPKKEIKYVPREETEKDRVFAIIYDACRWGYRFTDPYYGIPLIEKEDIEEKENGIYVIRFRCEPHYLHRIRFGEVSEAVCKALRSGMHFVHEQKTEWGLPYEDCAWVLQVGEEKHIWEVFFEGTKINNGDIDMDAKTSPKKCTHERWDEFLQSRYNRTLLSVAQELGYSEQNLDLLGCASEDALGKKSLYKKYKKLFDSFLNDEWNKSLVDGRNVLDYFKDLIASWIGEDLLVKALNEYGFKASLANADSDRVIKTERRSVTGEPDIKVEYDGHVRYLELMNALSPVEKYGQFDLRLTKAKNQFTKKTIFLLHGLCDGKFVLIDFMRDNVTVTYNFPNPRFGNKPCSVVKFEDNGIKMQEMALFWETLKDIISNTNPEPPHCLKMVDYATGNIDTLTTEENAEDSDDTADSIETEDDSESTPEENAESPEASDETEQAQTEEIDLLPGTQQIEKPLEEESPLEDEDPPPEPPAEDDEESIIEEDENGQAVEYTPEQWAALNDGF